MKCSRCGAEMVRDISTARCPKCNYFADLLPVDRAKLAEWFTHEPVERTCLECGRVWPCTCNGGRKLQGLPPLES